MKEKKDTNVSKKNEKRKLIMGIAMMLIAVAIAGGTYAYYQTTITGNVSGSILEWSCTNTGTTSSGTVDLGSLKPGVNGEFTFKIASPNFRTDITVEMWYSNTANVPGNFKLYKTKSGTNYSNSIAMATTGGTNPSHVTAFSDSNVAAGTAGKTYTVYWNWPIGTSAETPIATGASSNNKTLTINYKITCNQSTSYNS